MKKIISIILIGIIITSSLGVSAINDKTENLIKIESDSVNISLPIISEFEEYYSIDVEESTSLIIEPGEPVLPKITKVYILPFRSKIKDISVKFSESIEQKISKEIRPGYDPIINSEDQIIIEKSEEIYSSSELYPKKPYSYRTTTGLNYDEHVVYLIIELYPIRYSPAENKIYHSKSFDVTITYEKPSEPMNFPDENDLLIITPSEFKQALQPLVDHKNGINIKSYIATLEDIYIENTEGYDDQENIKLFIKDAIEEKGITYVLLVGGLKGQKNEWHLPVRYGHSPSEDSYLSDLYYSDIYKENGTAFEDWDSNGNNIFAEYGSFINQRDVIDGSPDVYIGRLACRSLDQVNIMVNKIINYETTPADNSWFKKMLLIGGDTYPESPEGFEAEIDTNLSASYMIDYEPVKLWASLGTLSGMADVEQAIDDGAGFIHMAGHANPSILVTYPPYDAEKENKIVILQVYNIFNPLKLNPKINNNNKLPIIVVGGCHNSQFNVSLSNIFRDIKEYGLQNYLFSRVYYMEWIPKCWSWWLTSKENGGAIATMGNTGLGMGLWGFDYTTGLDGWLLPRFYYNYGILGKENIGMAHSAAITDYANEFDINTDGEDRQMIQQWALLGDPSLMPGGYN